MPQQLDRSSDIRLRHVDPRKVFEHVGIIRH
jgi:hypothetical protein